ncbi:MAG: hypothetical protein JO209_05880 [Acidisphaera sp.]|nr:hypothetical protein [Acidisphaera sp.]
MRTAREERRNAIPGGDGRTVRFVRSPWAETLSFALAGIAAIAALAFAEAAFRLRNALSAGQAGARVQTGLIEVGASDQDGSIRYWIAKETVRQGELLLASQIAEMNSLMARASSILGWSVTIVLALGAALAALHVPASSARDAGLAGRFFVPVMLTAISSFVAAVVCVFVLWPGRWHAPGHEPRWVASIPFPSELETLEAMGGGYAQAAARNAVALRRLELSLRAFFAAAPAVGLFAYCVQAMFSG